MNTPFFGYIPKHERTPEQQRVHEAIMAAMPKFQIKGTPWFYGKTPNKVFLWDYWKHPSVLAANNGKVFSGMHQLTGSCFPAGTPVRLADGSEKPIEQIKIGDKVITHNRSIKPVTQIMRRSYTGDMITIHVKGYPFPLTMTSDHKIAVAKTKKTWRWKPGELEWVEASELKKDDRVVIGYLPKKIDPAVIDTVKILGENCLVLDDLVANNYDDICLHRPEVAKSLCINQRKMGAVKLIGTKYSNAIPRYIVVDEKLGRFIGLYLAEGGYDNGRLTFTFSSKEESLADEIISLTQEIFACKAEKIRQSSRPSVLSVRIQNLNIAKLIKEIIPGNVYTKRVPNVMMNASEKVKLSILIGWLDGDGYKVLAKKKRGLSSKIQGVTVSENLAKDMLAIALSCGLRTTCSIRKARKHSKRAYDVRFSGEKILTLFPKIYKQFFESPKNRITDADTKRTPYGYCQKIEKIIKVKVCSFPVYDFEVQDDHSFVANGLVVHNCVGAGGGNTIYSLAAMEVARLNQPELAIIPFWPLTYGKSREIGGMNGPGEGSFGSAFAEAARTCGVLPSTYEGLPTYTDNDGIVYGSSVEMKWSDGRAIPKKYLDVSVKHLVKSTSPIRSADEARDALLNNYPVSCAGMWGGKMQCPIVGNEVKVLLNSRATTWSHQQSLHGWMDHPEFGELFYWLNQWGLDTHGHCPTGAPAGGYWTKKADLEWQIRNDGELFAFSQFEDGFPATQFSWKDVV